MTTESFTTTVLTAASGCFLTQAADIDPRLRVVASTVALGRNDAPENWREIDAAEADALRAAAEEAAAADAAAEAEPTAPDAL